MAERKRLDTGKAKKDLETAGRFVSSFLRGARFAGKLNVQGEVHMTFGANTEIYGPKLPPLESATAVITEVSVRQAVISQSVQDARNESLAAAELSYEQEECQKLGLDQRDGVTPFEELTEKDIAEMKAIGLDIPVASPADTSAQYDDRDGMD